LQKRIVGLSSLLCYGFFVFKLCLVLRVSAESLFYSLAPFWSNNGEALPQS
jgi:hypothetical protein